MKKRDVFNQLKQVQLEHDIQALRWEKRSLTDPDCADWVRFAHTDSSKGVGIFKAISRLLGDDYDSAGNMNDESLALLETWSDLHIEVYNIKQQQKEVAH